MDIKHKRLEVLSSVNELKDLCSSISQQKIFEVYDYTFFDGQISEKLEYQNRNLRFVCKKDDEVPYITLNVKKMKGIWTYFFSINPKQMKNSIPPDVAFHMGLPEETPREVVSFLYSMELGITCLVLLLWRKIDWSFLEILKDPSFQSLYLNLFDVNTLPDPSVVKVNATKTYKSVVIADGLPPQQFFVNWMNSCFLDSILMTLFLCDSEFFREAILFTPATSKEPICFMSEEESLSYRKGLSQEFKEAYYNITSSAKSQKCVSLRNQIGKCIPGMLDNPFSATEIYSHLVDSFPQLNIENVPMTSNDDPYENKPLFQVWDFIDPDTSGKVVDWENINTKVLVFSNGLNPPIKFLNSIHPEKVITIGPSATKKVKVERQKPTGEKYFVEVPKQVRKVIKVTKARVFDEYLLDGRYRLCGVVMNIGPGDGAHYISYIRPSYDSGVWYYYDDLSPEYKKIDRLPKSVFENTDQSRPELLFYQRLKIQVEENKRRYSFPDIGSSITMNAVRPVSKIVKQPPKKKESITPHVSKIHKVSPTSNKLLVRIFCNDHPSVSIEFNPVEKKSNYLYQIDLQIRPTSFKQDDIWLWSFETKEEVNLFLREIERVADIIVEIY